MNQKKKNMKNLKEQKLENNGIFQEKSNLKDKKKISKRW
jgi:hypothetical protein